MKKNFAKSALILIAFGLFAITASSCNKGYGCPNEFSLGKAVSVPMQMLHQY